MSFIIHPFSKYGASSRYRYFSRHGKIAVSKIGYMGADTLLVEGGIDH